MRDTFSTTAINTRPLTGTTGTQLSGIDLSRPLSRDLRETIAGALDASAVLLFRQQTLSVDAQIELTRVFGACEPHPLPSHRGPDSHPELLVVEHRPGLRSRRNDVWHSDMSFAETPPSVTVLHAIAVPQSRGDTLICNLAAAYEMLSPGLKRALAPLRAEHRAGPEVAQVHAQQSGHEDMTGPRPTLHPVVRLHPQSGQQSLFVNPYYTTRFEDMTADESRPLLDHLYQVSLEPRNIYRHRWQKGDVLLWDNARTMHYAIRDYADDDVRVMHRTTAAGDRPV